MVLAAMPNPRPFLKAASKAASKVGRIVFQDPPPIPEGATRLYRSDFLPGATSGNAALGWGVTEHGAARDPHLGRWWTDSLDGVNWYHGRRGETGSVLFLDLPSELADKYRLSNLPKNHPARAFSDIHEEEFLLPPELSTKGKHYSGFLPTQGARREFYESRRFPHGSGFKKRPFLNE